MAARLLKGRMKPPARRGTESDSSKRRDNPPRRDQPSQPTNVYRDTLSESNVIMPTSQPVLIQRSQSLDNSTNPTNYGANFDQAPNPFRNIAYGYPNSHNNPEVAMTIDQATTSHGRGPASNPSDHTQANKKIHQDYPYGTTYYDQDLTQPDPFMGQHTQSGHGYASDKAEDGVYREDYQVDCSPRLDGRWNDYHADTYICPREGNTHSDLQDEQRNWRSASLADNFYPEPSGAIGVSPRNSSFKLPSTGDSRIDSKAIRSNSLAVYSNTEGHQYNSDQPGGLNLRASYQRFDANLAYQRDVDVWQDNSSTYWPSQTIPRLSFRTLLFDTQCRESNWVSRKIIRELGAEVRVLSRSANFVGFNGQVMAATEEVSLSFKNSQGGSTYTARFLVSSDETVPFDMVLGADDCRKFNIIQEPTFLGLVPIKQTKEEKAAQSKGMAEQEAMAREHERQRKQREKLKAAGSRGLSQGGQSSKKNDYF